MNEGKSFMVQYSLKLWGPFQLERQPAQSDRFESDKVRALLAYLATEPGAHRRGSLATLLWPEKPEHKARRSLSQALYNLRQITSPVAEGVFEVTPRTIRFVPNEHFQVDVLHFERNLQLVNQHPHPHGILCGGCSRRLGTAVGLHRGEFLAALYVSESTVFEDWLRQKRELLRGKLMEALRSLADSSETLGDYPTALKHLQQVQELDPLSEETCRQRMRLLALSGQRNDALRQYEGFSQMLWDELGVEPEETTRSLYHHLLAMDEPDIASIYPRQRPRTLRSGHDAWGEAQTLEVVGEMARARGRYASAKESHERALKLYQESGDQGGAARSLSFLGLTARDTGDFVQARQFIQQARGVYFELGDRFSGAEANITLARLFTYLGEFSNAVELLNAAMPVYRDLGLQQRLAYHTVALGFHQMTLGQYAEARTTASQGMDLSYAVGDQLAICWGMDVLGMVAIAEEKYNTAEQLLKQTLVLANAIGRPEELGSVLGSLGYIMLKRGNPERARLHIRDGLQLLSNSHNVVAALFILPAAALLLERRGETEHAYELFLLCKRFAFFDKSAYFYALYAPYFKDWDSTRFAAGETKAAASLLWHAVDDLLTQI